MCGNGKADLGYGEQCDDGNTNNGDGCDSSCQRETRADERCTDPGVLNYQFNYVAAITQTCQSSNGSACTSWAPTTTTVYNAVGSYTDCYFICQAGYTWNGSSCASGGGQTCGNALKE
jgi:cysteine-rich repeat protein